MTKSLPPNVTIATRANHAATLFKQASDATRLQILMLLAKQDLNVGPLCEALGNMSQPAVSHHLALAKYGGLVESRRAGKNNFYSLTDKGRSLLRAAESLES